MTIDPNDSKHIIADEGKKFIRKEDGLDYGTEIFLGYTYYINGVRIDPPKEEQIEDFDEVDMTPEEIEEYNKMKEEINSNEQANEN